MATMPHLILLFLLSEKALGNLSTYIGCQHLDDSLMTPVDDSEVESVGHCVSKCLTSGYSYAGTYQSNTCFCGQEYNQTELVNSTLCSMHCVSSAQEECGGANSLSIYCTQIDLEQENPHHTEFEADHTIAVPPSLWVTSFIVHPQEPDSVLATVKTQVIKFSSSGCAVIAGANDTHLCDYIPNKLTFGHLMSICHANLSITNNWERRLGSEHSLLIIDRQRACTNFIDLENMTGSVPNCSTKALYHGYDILTQGDYPADFPNMKTVHFYYVEFVAYEDHLVLVFSKPRDNLILMLYKWGFESVRLSKPWNSLIDTGPFHKISYSAKRDQRTDNTWMCSLTKLARSPPQFFPAISHYCKRVISQYPAYFRGRTFVVDSDNLREIVWPVSHLSEPIKLPVDIYGSASEAATIVIGAPAGLWVHSHEIHTFKFLRPSIRNETVPKSHKMGQLKLSRLGEGYCSGIHVASLTVQLLENCAFSCFKTAKCYSFSFSQNEKKLNCHLHGKSLGVSGQYYSGECYGATF